VQFGTAQLNRNPYASAVQPNIALESLIEGKQPAIFLEGGPLVLPAVAPSVIVPAVVNRDARETFLWTAAHELRQPLSVLSTAVALVKQDAPSAATLRATRIMERQIKQMSRMIEDLVDAARLTNGKVSLQLQRIDLRDVVREAAGNVAAAILARNQTFEIHCGSVPLWVHADPQRLDQVFSNLLHNAIKYTDPGGRIIVSVERGPLTVTARVLDTGAGIGAPGLSRIFDLFAQIQPASSGLGVGLNVVREILALHSGLIQAHSDGVGKGTEFVVVLPRVD
jgi:two-component system, sensor histidine kinase